jgi:hypothetical protein
LSAIATQATQIQSTCCRWPTPRTAAANTSSAAIHADAAVQLTATGATYNGDQGQRQVQIAAGQTVADGDNGDLVFNQIKTGNGTFDVTPAAGNTGSG